jgi:hypothetical protein
MPEHLELQPRRVPFARGVEFLVNPLRQLLRRQHGRHGAKPQDPRTQRPVVADAQADDDRAVFAFGDVLLPWVRVGVLR